VGGLGARIVVAVTIRRRDPSQPVPRPELVPRTLTSPERPILVWTRLARGLTCRIGITLSVLALVLAGVSSAPASGVSVKAKPAATPSPKHPLIAAYYFGIGNPNNFWTTNMSGARSTFKQMKSNGFNAVALLISWPGFEPRTHPVVFNTKAFARLDRLIRIASSLDMDVVLRLSYQTNSELFSSNRVYAAWLDYISKVHRNVKRYHNVRMAFLSWEDFWEPVSSSQQPLSTSQRVRLAKSLGYTAWLRQNYSLSQVEYYYGQSFSGWGQVPTPLQFQPAYALMFQFDDAALVNRFFLAARDRFPGLTLEARVDGDTIFNGSDPLYLYYHTAEWQLPGTSTTGMYFDPYMGDPTNAPHESAGEALDALKTTLKFVHGGSGGRRLYVNEFEFASNAPQVAAAPHLAPNQVLPFLDNSAPILAKYTDGYALFTYRNFTMSPIHNPSFAVGHSGWKITGTALPVDRPSGASYLDMNSGSRAKQRVDANLLRTGGRTPITLSIQASSNSGHARLKVQVGSAPSRTIRVKRGWHTYELTYRNNQVPSGSLRFQALAPVKITNVQIYNFVQQGDVYGVTGHPLLAVSGVRTLNQELAAR
jgi:hypothetical protein